MLKILKSLLKFIGILVGVLLFYLAVAQVLSMIPVKAEKTSDPKTVDVYLFTNGVHTDIVVPVRSEEMDWSTMIPFEDTKSKRTDFKYLGIGWGDKGFYLDTPTWAELKPSTAVKAAFWMSESAMHCTFYERMIEGEDCVKVSLTSEQYINLVNFIKEKFDYDAQGKVMLIPTDAVYGENDSFYDAKGRYSFLETCNTWTNEGLKEAGQKAALWTISDFGIFDHYQD